MANGNSIINLGDLSKPVNTLIKKIADAIGVLYEPSRIVKKAKAEAKAEEIMELNNLKIDVLKKRAINRLISEEVIKQDNMENIISKTIPLINNEAKPEAVDNDWIVYFFEKSRLVSNENMQTLWSKILAGETNTPGSFSRLTLKIISDLEKKDADLFTSIASCTFIIEEPKVMIYWDEMKEVYSRFGIDFNGLTQLDTIGLIKFNHINGFMKNDIPKNFTVSYFGYPLEIKLHYANTGMYLGNVLLTQTGSQLLGICGAIPSEEIKNATMLYWRNFGIFNVI